MISGFYFYIFIFYVNIVGIYTFDSMEEKIMNWDLLFGKKMRKKEKMELKKCCVFSREWNGNGYLLTGTY